MKKPKDTFTITFERDEEGFIATHMGKTGHWYYYELIGLLFMQTRYLETQSRLMARKVKREKGEPYIIPNKLKKK